MGSVLIREGSMNLGIMLKREFPLYKNFSLHALFCPVSRLERCPYFEIERFYHNIIIILSKISPCSYINFSSLCSSSFAERLADWADER